MRDRIIKFLGGVSRADYLLLNSEYNSQREMTSYLRARNEELIKSLENEITERKNLQNLLFVKAGIIQNETIFTDSIDHDPIRVAPRNVRQTMRDMEINDRLRAKSFKGDPAV